ncbi:hypothetical protein SLEP1_g12523 [Rubroshorea leprosula]|uniref:CCHC-type domain-containing protein n=1 Tax=Rubroshorea leprosula TaxID=152421 RepID=A0AAV5IIJ2_9ROSI|nr:hypothetical protein SLEP1_g12523 [Rubroshorea leprosula]
MAQFLSSQPLEGLFTTKPPFFDGTNYNYWKNRMKVFMLANVPKAWVVTMKGPYVPMKIVGEREVPKEEIDWNDEDLEKIMINNKAIKVVRKVLRSLPKSWEAKKTAIEESKDLNTLKLEDLIGKLMTYETEVQGDGGVEIVEKKKKDVAFKVSNQKEKSEDDASDGENFSYLISREVRRFMKKNIKSKLARRDEGESTKKSVKCYECNKMGHYRNKCPKLKKGEKKDKKSMKKKAFAATWSNDETSSTESESSLEKGVANLCFMAQEDSNNDEEVCLVSKMKSKWYLDSGCSRHMMGDPSQFSSLMPLDGRASMSVISKLLKHDLVDGLPKVNVNIDNVCDACMKGKQIRVSFKTKKCISTNRPLDGNQDDSISTTSCDPLHTQGGPVM